MSKQFYRIELYHTHTALILKAAIQDKIIFSPYFLNVVNGLSRCQDNRGIELYGQAKTVIYLRVYRVLK